MSPAKSAAGTVAVMAGICVFAWAYERWPTAALGSVAAASIYGRLREMKEPEPT